MFVSPLKAEDRNCVLFVSVKRRGGQFIKGFIYPAKKFRLYPEVCKKKPLGTLVMLIRTLQKDHSGSDTREWTSGKQGAAAWGGGSTLEATRSLRKQLL